MPFQGCLTYAVWATARRIVALWWMIWEPFLFRLNQRYPPFPNVHSIAVLRPIRYHTCQSNAFQSELISTLLCHSSCFQRFPSVWSLKQKRHQMIKQCCGSFDWYSWFAQGSLRTLQSPRLPVVSALFALSVPSAAATWICSHTSSFAGHMAEEISWFGYRTSKYFPCCGFFPRILVFFVLRLGERCLLSASSAPLPDLTCLQLFEEDFGSSSSSLRKLVRSNVSLLPDLNLRR